MGIPIFDQPTVMTRIVTSKDLIVMYVVITFFDNASVYAYSCSSEKELITYMGQAINYKPGSQGGANIKRLQAYKVDATSYTLTIVHDVEV